MENVKKYFERSVLALVFALAGQGAVSLLERTGVVDTRATIQVPMSYTQLDAEDDAEERYARDMRHAEDMRARRKG